MKKIVSLICVLALSSAQLCAVAFKVTSRVNNAAFGSIHPVDTESVYEEGADITYTLAPVAGCEVLKLSVNGVDKTAEIEGGVYQVAGLSEDLVIVASFRPAGQNYFLVMPPLPFPEMPGLSNWPLTKEAFDPVTHKITSFPVQVEDTAKFMTVRPGNRPGEVAAVVHPEVADPGKWHVIGYDICLLDGPRTLKPGYYDLTYVWNDLDSMYYIQDDFVALFPFTVRVNVSEPGWGTDALCGDCGVFVHLKGEPERVYAMKPMQAEGWYSYTFEGEPAGLEIYFTNNGNGTGEEQSESVAPVFSNRCLTVRADRSVVDADCPPADAVFIATADELVEKLTDNTDPEARFVLTADLDLGTWIEAQTGNDIRTKGWESLGSSTQPITGTLDGAGFFLYDLWSNRPTESSSGGFIAFARNLTIRNLGIKTKAGQALIGKDNVGGFVCDFDKVRMEQCCFNGVVRGEKQVGALLGSTETESSSIQRSYAYGGVYGTDNVGGLWGKTAQKNSLIEEAYAMVTVNGKGGQGSAGGIIGSVDMAGATGEDIVITIRNTFALNDTIAGAYSVASISAYTRQSKNVTIINSVQLDDATVREGARKPFGKNATYSYTKEQILSVDTVFVNRDWSFTDVWQFGNGHYPAPVLKNLNLNYQPDQAPHHLNIPTGLLVPEVEAVRVYPNPTDGRLFVQTATPVSVSVYDAMGRWMKTVVSDSEIDISDCPAGFYILKAGNRYVKILKK
jgi:hypothetical protein